MSQWHGSNKGVGGAREVSRGKYKRDNYIRHTGVDLKIAHNSPHLEVGCGTHTWEAMGMSTLTSCRLLRLLSRSRWKRKTKVMSTLLMSFFVDLGSFHSQCLEHYINQGNFFR